MVLNITDEQARHIKNVTDKYMTNSIGMLYGERTELAGYFIDQCISKDNTIINTNTCLDLKEGIDDIAAARATLYDARKSIYETIGYQAVIPYRREALSGRLRDTNNIQEYKL
jgi:hypothetical protein